MRTRGVTLLEVSIVLALIACLATIGLSFTNLIDRSLVAFELKRIYALFTSLHHRAVVTGQRQTLCLGTEQADQLSVHPLCRGVVLGYSPGIHGPPGNVNGKLLDSAITFPKKRATFYEDGSVQAGSLYLTDQNRTVTYALTVDAGSCSYIRCYVYNKGWKLLS
jgi:prepilin-type N-terminal cleavage/methylation domain-containing protein